MSINWKTVCASTVGTSHSKRGDPCQDYAAVREVSSGGHQFLIVACADGAGSCPLSDEGAALACATFLDLVDADLRANLDEGWDLRQRLLEWNLQVRNRILQEAEARGVAAQDFSCTLLAAVVGENVAGFSQIGDGAIVIRRNGNLGVVFWPQSGEYVNTTNFITSNGLENNLELHTEPERLEEIAVFTDGLQSLCLRFASREAHSPFFEPMFDALRRSETDKNLTDSLKDFLTSDPVNARTDDDKTLVLASRIAATNAASSQTP